MVARVDVIVKAYSLSCLAPVLRKHSGWGLKYLEQLETFRHLSISLVPPCSLSCLVTL